MTPDPDLNDDDLETEIQLVGELVLAASQSEDHLSDQRIDEVLGLDDGQVGRGDAGRDDGQDEAAPPADEPER